MRAGKLSRSTFYTEGRPTPAGWVLIGVATPVLAVVAATGFLLIAAFSIDLPVPEKAPGGRATAVLDASGELVGTLKGEQKRQIVPLEEMSSVLPQAVLAAEDRRFYEHSGISPRGMVRALFTNVGAGQVKQGGSTITQQYARNAFGRIGSERTVSRKIKEIVLARRIDSRYPKDKILEFYLNTIYFGRGAYGAEAASLTYFKKSAKDLTLDEAAFLAGAIRAPEHFQPDSDPQAAVRIRNEVLEDMVESGTLEPEQAVQARATDLLSKFKLGPTHLDSSRAGYFMEHVRRLLRDRHGFSDAELLGGGLTISTGLDLEMQDAAETAVAGVLSETTDPEAAIVAMDPEGFVRAMVGGRDVSDRVRALGFNFAANVREEDQGGRPAGSVFKPLALARFLEEGYSVSERFRGPRSITIEEARCRTAEGEPWTVSNYGNESFGRLDVLGATTRSVNTVYAQIMAEPVTPEEFVHTAELLGVAIPARDEGCALALGTTAVTPLEMAVAYTTFAARGHRPDPLVVTKVTDPTGEVLFERSPRMTRVLSTHVADTVNYTLQRVITSGTARQAGIGRPAAGKTGTTENYHDAWFAGYTPDLTAVVWMGYAPDASGRIPEMTAVRGRRVTGGSFPALIWKRFMQTALRGLEATDFVTPRELAPDPNPPPAAAPAPRCPEGHILTPQRECTPVEMPSPQPIPEPAAVMPPSPTPAQPALRLGPSPRDSPEPQPTPTGAGAATPTPAPSAQASPSPSTPPTPEVADPVEAGD